MATQQDRIVTLVADEDNTAGYIGGLENAVEQVERAATLEVALQELRADLKSEKEAAEKEAAGRE